MLAAVQSLGNLATSAGPGALWTAVSPTAAVAYLDAWMLVALAGPLMTAARRTDYRSHVASSAPAST
ncbi:hypothetical protein [Streptomyces sp. NPDC002133]|uniref:hypothetical protein n=1 Tax=Streptomyces sp. NPDC002133 TaxID=3154409 RepID=UPI0033283FE4